MTLLQSPSSFLLTADQGRNRAHPSTEQGHHLPGAVLGLRCPDSPCGQVRRQNSNLWRLQTDHQRCLQDRSISTPSHRRQSFTKLDLAHAYQQIPLTVDSKRYTTINTHKGLFRYNRLPFGVASAAAILQHMMDSLLQGLPHVCVYLDDILITGPTDEAHTKMLDEVLRRLNDADVHLKREKCFFMLPSVEYLGHRISASGLQPTDRKIKALKDAPVPHISQLKPFLGLLNYYVKFTPKLFTLFAPLYRLLQKKSTWTWGLEQQGVFDRAKGILTSDSVLAYYDPSKPLILASDTSLYGVGAVL